MARARGRLIKGSFGVIEVIDNIVIIKEERGIIGKKLKTIGQFPINATISSNLESNQPPYKRFKRISIIYESEEKQTEEVFFSQDEEALKTIMEIIDTDIERRRIERDQDLVKERRVREIFVHQLNLNLDLLDNVFQILFLLEGELSWDAIGKHLHEAGKIIEGLRKLAVIAPLNYDVNGLSHSITKRNVEKIKDECYAIISIINRDAERLAHFKDSMEGFDLVLHEIFVKSYLILWEMKLGELHSSHIDEEQLNRLLIYIKMLGGYEMPEQLIKELARVKTLGMLDGIDPHFERIRLQLYQCLNSIIE